MTQKVNAKILIDFKKYQYLLSLQPDQKEQDIELNDKDKQEENEHHVNEMSENSKGDASVAELASMHNQLLSNTMKLQNIAQENLKEENSTVNPTMSKTDTKLIPDTQVKTKIVKKSEKRSKRKKQYTEEQVSHNGVKWYRLK
jgi:hypothetical protein